MEFFYNRMEFFIPFTISCVLAVIIRYFMTKSDKDYYESQIEKMREHLRDLGDMEVMVDMEVPKRGAKDFEKKADAFIEHCKYIVDTSNETLSKFKNNKRN